MCEDDGGDPEHAAVTLPHRASVCSLALTSHSQPPNAKGKARR